MYNIFCKIFLAVDFGRDSVIFTNVTYFSWPRQTIQMCYAGDGVNIMMYYCLAYIYRGVYKVSKK